MKLTGQEKEQLQQALIDAFNYQSLKQMLTFKLDKDLDTITTSIGFSNIVFDLITIANQEGWVVKLITSAKEYNSGNQILAGISNTLLTRLTFTPITIVNELVAKEAFDLTNIIRVCRKVLLKSPKIHTFIIDCNKDEFLKVFFNRLKKDSPLVEREKLVKKVNTIKFISPASTILQLVTTYKPLLQTHHLCLFIKIEEYDNCQEILDFINSINSNFTDHQERTLLVIICLSTRIEINISSDITILPSLSFSTDDMMDWIIKIANELNWERITNKWIGESFRQCCLDELANTTNILDPSLVYDYIENIISIFKDHSPNSPEEFLSKLNPTL